METNLSIINPFSSKYHCLHQFKENLSGKQRVAAIAAAVFGSIIPVIGTTAAFRKVVQHYAVPEEWQDPNFINLPPNGLNFDKNILVKKLLKQGLNPDNFKYKRIWTNAYTPGNNAEMFGGERAPFYAQKDVDLYNSTQPEENLLLHIPLADEYMKVFKRRFFRTRPHVIGLTIEQAFGKERLPSEFIDFVKKTN
ncbi:MAG: hypothetical protein ACK5MA_05235 [Parachlamydiaceae bacterium]